MFPASSTASNVNFLPKEKYLTSQEVEKRRLVLGISFTILTVYLVVVIGLVFTKLYFASQSQKLSRSIADLTTQLNQYHQIETRYLVLADRTQKITALATSPAADPFQTLSAIQAALPPEVNFSQFSIKGKTLTAEITMANPHSLESASGSLQTLATRLGFNRLKISHLGRTASTLYSATLEFTSVAVTKKPST